MLSTAQGSSRFLGVGQVFATSMIRGLSTLSNTDTQLAGPHRGTFQQPCGRSAGGPPGVRVLNLQIIEQLVSEEGLEIGMSRVGVPHVGRSEYAPPYILCSCDLLQVQTEPLSTQVEGKLRVCVLLGQRVVDGAPD